MFSAFHIGSYNVGITNVSSAVAPPSIETLNYKLCAQFTGNSRSLDFNHIIILMLFCSFLNCIYINSINLKLPLIKKTPTQSIKGKKKTSEQQYQQIMNKPDQMDQERIKN